MRHVPTEKELLEGLNEDTAHADALANPTDEEWGVNSGEGEQNEAAVSPLERLRGSVKHFDQPCEPLPDWGEWYDGEGASEDFMPNRDQPSGQKR